MVNHTCSASSCGNIHNIRFPFRLKTDPENCGDFSYNLSCENNRTVLIRKDNYFSFSTPKFSLYRYSSIYPYSTHRWKKTKSEMNLQRLSLSVVLMSCEKPVNSPLYLDTSTCNYNDNSSSISDSKRYRYVGVGITNVSEVEESCKVEKMFPTSWPRSDDSNISSKIVLGTPCVVAVLICKWQKRHLPMYDNAEEFLQSHINLMPIRYSYLETRKMSNGFEDKLDEGGYGSVYKGKLQSSLLVVIKVLGGSKANGQDFINEVATIGRIHHENVVQLIGYCAERLKRALIYEFIIEKTYDIALGVARGIEYLHRGCDMQILHFDIKPHNILLDENFTPKVFDFGLAKLYPIDDSIVSLTATRGTLGYIAPELFYKNIGGVSYKADVYSFGMLLLEIASRRKNFNQFVDHSSHIYFPTWVYGQFSEGNDIEMEDVTEEEKKTTKKMIIVALWCIQMKPSDRPSMNKVVKMLEGEVESFQMPSNPFLSSSPGRPTGDRSIGNVGDNLNPTCSSIHLGGSSHSTQF
ncbi:hypothetical protein ACB092_12G049000 [Castanea dentata]